MKIRIKSGYFPSYLTVGKVYEIVEFDGNTNEHAIISDNNWLTWVFINCDEIHINGGSWEIVNES